MGTSISTTIHLGSPFTNVGPLSGLASAFNVGLLQISGTSSGNSTGPGNNLPSGMTVVMDTGHFTAPSTISNSGASFTTTGNVPVTINNLSPASPSSVGEWAGNLSPVPGGTGLRMTYATNLHGGNSPARFQISSFPVTGTGYLYFAFLYRMPSTWSYSTATGNKIFEPHTVNANNNHVIAMNATGTDSNTHPTGNAYPEVIFQYAPPNSTFNGVVPGGKPGTTNGLPPYFAGPATLYSPNASAANLLSSSNADNFNIMEFYFQPESPVGIPGGSNAQVTMWVNGNEVWTSVGQNDGTAGQTGMFFNSGGWANILCDPTYGGDADTDRPPTGCYWDVDWMFAAVK